MENHAMRTKLKTSIVPLALSLLAFCAYAQDQSTVVNFESLPHENELEGVGDIVSENGFTFVYTPAPDEPYPVGFQSVGASWRFNLRSTALNSNSCSSQVSLVANDDRPFSVASIDLAPLNGDPGVSVTFIGMRSDGKKFTRTMRLRNSTTWTTFRFPGSFRNLSMLTWHQGDCLVEMPHMFDNVVLSQRSP